MIRSIFGDCWATSEFACCRNSAICCRLSDPVTSFQFARSVWGLIPQSLRYRPHRCRMEPAGTAAACAQTRRPSRQTCSAAVPGSCCRMICRRGEPLMMAPKRFVVASATCWSIPLGWCCWSRSRPPVCRIGRERAPTQLRALTTQFRRLRVICRWCLCRRRTAVGLWIAEVGQATTGDRVQVKGQRGFAVVPWRWIVERTFAWLGRHRRLKADCECLPETTEALIHIAMIRLMVRRLAPQ